MKAEELIKQVRAGSDPTHLVEAKDIDNIIKNFKSGAYDGRKRPEDVFKIYAAAEAVISKIGRKKALDVMDKVYDYEPTSDTDNSPEWKTFLQIEKIWQRYFKRGNLDSYAFEALQVMIAKLKSNPK